MDMEKYLPLHSKVKMALEKEIFDGIYEERIPGEMELMERFSVSRATVRRAIKELVDEGVLKTIHGKGTFISFKPVEEWLGMFSTFQDVVRQRGMKPSIRFLDMHITSEPEAVAEALGESRFYCMKRIRLADNIPISVERNYYPIGIGEKFLGCDLNDMATYAKLEKSGIALWEAKQIITARLPEEEERELLDLDEYMPVFFIERVNYDPEGNVVEYEQSVYRSDYYAFVVNFKRG